MPNLKRTISFVIAVSFCSTLIPQSAVADRPPSVHSVETSLSDALRGLPEVLQDRSLRVYQFLLSQYRLLQNDPVVTSPVASPQEMIKGQ